MSRAARALFGVGRLGNAPEALAAPCGGFVSTIARQPHAMLGRCEGLLLARRGADEVEDRLRDALRVLQV